MLKIGLTGGIGSGKTTVAKVFEVLGIPVYYADEAAKRLMNEDENLIERLQQQFGEQTYADGKLNRSFLSSLVFNDPEKLAILNSIVHPATIEDAARWMKQQTTPYVIKEAALIFESGSQKDLDKVIGVYAPTPLRILRVIKRDNINKEEIEARMNKQLDEEMKMRLCDYVIKNDEQEMVLPQVLELHKKFLSEP
jgi:dephospho-CoA kinase